MDQRCQFPHCTCTEFEPNRWVPERCTCLHAKTWHTPEGASTARIKQAVDSVIHRAMHGSFPPVQSEPKPADSPSHSKSPVSRLASRSKVLPPAPVTDGPAKALASDAVTLSQIRTQSIADTSRAASASKQSVVSSSSFVAEESKARLGGIDSESPGVPRDRVGTDYKASPSIGGPDDLAQFASMEQYLLRTLPKLQAPNCYSEKMQGLEKHGFRQLLTGLGQIKRMGTFFKGIAEAEAQYAQTLKKIVDAELEQLTTGEQDRMGSVWAAWMSVVQHVAEVSSIHDDHRRSLASAVSKPLESFFGEGIKSFESLTLEHEALNEAIRALRTHVEKSKEECIEAISPFLKEFSMKRKLMALTKSEESFKGKSYEQCCSYDDLISGANQFLHTHTHMYLPVVLSRMQAYEEKRLHVTKKYLERYLESSLEAISSIQKKEQKCLEIVQSISVKKDVVNFSEFAQSERSAAAVYSITSDPLAPFAYSLPLSLSDIRRKMGVKKTTKVDLRASLSNIVETESKLYPELKLQLPRAFTCLKRAIEDQGGLIVEGIFRVPGDFVEIEKVISLVEDGDYDLINPSTVHTTASAFKKWLRELKDPLIPESF